MEDETAGKEATVSNNGLTEARRRLADATHDVAAARSRLRDAEEAAWERYLAEVKEALREDLDLPADERGSDDIVHDLLEAARGFVDDLRLQAHLGRMELDEVATELRDRLTGAVAARH